MSSTVYSTVNFRRSDRPDDVNQGEDVVYTEVKFSDHLPTQSVSGNTRAGTLSAQNTGPNFHRSRLSVCLGLLCILTVLITLGVHLHRASKRSRVTEGLLEKLELNFSIITNEKDQLQENRTIVNEKNHKLQKDIISLTNNINQLQKNYSALANDNEQLQEQYNELLENNNQLQKAFDALFSKAPYLDKYCHFTVKGNSCAQCPRGWIILNSSCYYVSQQTKTWQESKADCVQQGAHLVIIESKEEQEFVNKITSKNGWWIGLNFKEQNKVWSWVDGSELKTG